MLKQRQSKSVGLLSKVIKVLILLILAVSLMVGGFRLIEAKKKNAKADELQKEKEAMTQTEEKPAD